MHRIIPRAVARPATEAELGDALAWAAARGMAVTPRGAGSAMDGGSVGAGLVVDLSGFGLGQLAIDVAQRTARLAPSVSLGALEAQASHHQLRFGPDPSSAPWASIGGVIGTNAAGPRSYALGAVDRWVDAVRLLTGDGPLELRRGVAPDPHHPVIHRWQTEALPMLDAHAPSVRARWPATTKNTAGYGLHRYWATGDLLDLVIGAEGTLGIVTEATVRLEPTPACCASLRIVLPTRGAISVAVAALAPFDPVAIELLDGSLLQLIAAHLDAQGIPMPGAHGAILLVDFEGEDTALVAERLAGATRRLGPLALEVATALTPEARKALWAIRHAASPLLAAIDDGRRSLQVIEDGCVPVAVLDRYLEGIQRSCDAVGVDVVMFGHAGDGHVHVNLLPDLGAADWLARVQRIFDEVTELVIRLGGTPAGEHGAGRLRAGVLEALLGPEALEAFRAVKRAFDPDGRFNPGVILSDGTAPLSRLKVGTEAAGLPPGVEQELREIETQRRWGEARWQGTG